mmetsp:Transcript_107585/g.336958  ORF Transcript_107585/g.336958 Transcript_107585/m.336958 type:complete len:202 (+) Transcript_107585:1789-2394(+)
MRLRARLQIRGGRLPPDRPGGAAAHPCGVRVSPPPAAEDRRALRPRRALPRGRAGALRARRLGGRRRGAGGLGPRAGAGRGGPRAGGEARRVARGPQGELPVRPMHWLPETRQEAVGASLLATAARWNFTISRSERFCCDRHVCLRFAAGVILDRLEKPCCRGDLPRSMEQCTNCGILGVGSGTCDMCGWNQDAPPPQLSL